MRIKLLTVLTVIASVICLGSQAQAQQAQAQTPETLNSIKENYTLTGDSLVGVDNKTSLDDYTKFFGETNPGNSTVNNTDQKKAPSVLLLNQSVTIPILPNLQPIQFQGDNDKLQLQLDSRQ
jgi:hypothetical protein